ncbi:MAG TPA: hypothetical protein VHV54_23775 [Candidatus Binatia bacterium]|nr:hypothetical protein [Candidatus Binatia bacterium]
MRKKANVKLWEPASYDAFWEKIGLTADAAFSYVEAGRGWSASAFR